MYADMPPSYGETGNTNISTRYDAAHSSTATGVSAGGIPPGAIAELGRKTAERLAEFNNMIGSNAHAVMSINLLSLANRTCTEEISNPFVATTTATAVLKFLGHQPLEVRLGQEGSAEYRTRLRASEAAAAMVNHALSADGAAHPMFGALLASLLTIAGACVAALTHTNGERWTQLAGNLLPTHILAHGTPADAIKAAITLMSCQVRVQAMLLPHNFAGTPIDARFSGVDDAVHAASANNHPITESDVAQFIMHVLGSKRLPIWPEPPSDNPCSNNCLLMRVWMCNKLTDVFTDIDQVPDFVRADPVYQRMRYGATRAPPVATTLEGAQIAGFSKRSAAFSGPSEEYKPLTEHEARIWAQGWQQQQLEARRALMVAEFTREQFARNADTRSAHSNTSGIAPPYGLKPPEIGSNWGSDDDDEPNAQADANNAARLAADEELRAHLARIPIADLRLPPFGAAAAASGPAPPPTGAAAAASEPMPPPWRAYGQSKLATAFGPNSPTTSTSPQSPN